MARAQDRLRFDSENGATAVEYSIMLALVAAIIIGVVVTLGQGVVALFDTAVNAF